VPPRLLVKKGAKTVAVITQTPAVSVSKSRDLCFAAFAVVWPNTTELIIVNGTMFGRLQFAFDPIHKFPHNPKIGSTKFCPVSVMFVNANPARTNIGRNSWSARHRAEPPVCGGTVVNAVRSGFAASLRPRLVHPTYHGTITAVA
jgi:hypothetical protein